jgi:hypothetical protein
MSPTCSEPLPPRSGAADARWGTNPVCSGPERTSYSSAASAFGVATDPNACRRRSTNIGGGARRRCVRASSRSRSTRGCTRTPKSGQSRESGVQGDPRRGSRGSGRVIDGVAPLAKETRPIIRLAKEFGPRSGEQPRRHRGPAVRRELASREPAHRGIKSATVRNLAPISSSLRIAVGSACNVDAGQVCIRTMDSSPFALTPPTTLEISRWAVW